jgi:hypothetical protein
MEEVNNKIPLLKLFFSARNVVKKFINLETRIGTQNMPNINPPAENKKGGL